MPSYTIRAANSPEELEDRGAEYEQDGLDTIKQAKERARYLLTDQFMHSCEASEPLRYAAIYNQKGECVADFFRK